MSHTTVEWLQERCAAHLVETKWLICADRRAGLALKDRLNLSGNSTLNLHPHSLRSAVLAMIDSSLVASDWKFLDGQGSLALMHQVIADALQRGKLKYFRNEQHATGLAKLMSRSVQELRLAGIDPTQLPESAFHSQAKSHDIRSLLQAYEDQLRRHQFVDYPGCLAWALAALEEDRLALPDDLVLLIAERLDLSAREHKLLERLEQVVEGERYSTAEQDSAGGGMAEALRGLKCHFFSGYGDTNEARGVLQRVLRATPQGSQPLDSVEILYTDAALIPALYELFCEVASELVAEQPNDAHAIPSVEPAATFSEGIAAIYARPGRALRGWLRWIASDGLQSKLVQLVREGVFANTSLEGMDGEPIGYARLASQLRRLSIGFGLERYLPAIETAVVEAQQAQQAFLERLEDEGGDTQLADDERTANRDFGLAALEALQRVLNPLFALVPQPEDSVSQILGKARQFLLRCARSESKLDRLARNALLEEVDRRHAMLEFVEEPADNLLVWLEELPLQTHLLRSGPQPGCVHVTHVSRGGFTGRTNVFLMGMDANRYPRMPRVDPVLLDHERKLVSPDLRLSSEVADQQQQALLDTLHRVAETQDAQLTFSYSTRQLVEDRDLSPSPVLVEAFRLSQGQPQAHGEELRAQSGSPVTFASPRAADWLLPQDGRLAGLLMAPTTAKCQAELELQFPHFRTQRAAHEQRQSETFGTYDGWVPDAGPELAPTLTQRPVSASRMETMGACPRRYFFRYGLSVTPPEEWQADPEIWLDPIALGNLVHRLFERFLRDLTAEGRVPDVRRDLPALYQLLEQQIAQAREDIPVPNDDAFDRQYQWLRETCEIFLTKEQEYCHINHARPWVVEAAVGLDEEPQSELDCREPVTLTLSAGKQLQVVGRIDRVDRVQRAGSEAYAIWDYKSGSDFGFSREHPFQQGRKLQPLLYIGLLRHRLAAIGREPSADIRFGYFFPTPRTSGLRIEWTQLQLKPGRELLDSLCRLMEAGVFPATTNAADCKYCDYQQVCGPPQMVAADSLQKLDTPENAGPLADWGKLREDDLAGGDS